MSDHRPRTVSRRVRKSLRIPVQAQFRKASAQGHAQVRGYPWAWVWVETLAQAYTQTGAWPETQFEACTQTQPRTEKTGAGIQSVGQIG